MAFLAIGERLPESALFEGGEPERLDDRVSYYSEPARRVNPQGELMGAWVVRTLSLGMPDHGKAVAYFSADGRDAAERWAAKRGIRLVGYR